jgi:hypothetical protein
LPIPHNQRANIDNNPNLGSKFDKQRKVEELKKDLDFATSEVERLRAKLIVEDCGMPPLSDELFGVVAKKAITRSRYNQDNSDRINNSEFFSLKEQINQGE